MNSTGIVTLLTDLSESDGYVAAMKGVMLAIAPQLRLVDISHDIAPQDVFGAAFVLAATYAYFPLGTVHLVVVDPGVGSARRALAVQAAGHFFVAPDNGVLTAVMRGTGQTRAVSLTNRAYWRTPEISATFHGRDIFAPVAAHLAAGVAPDQLGEPAHDLQSLRWPAPAELPDGALQGEVLHIDRFGNLITNISQHQVLTRTACSIRLGEHTIIGLDETYASVPPGTPLALVDSHGILEIAVCQGNAARQLGLAKGAIVTLR